MKETVRIGDYDIQRENLQERVFRLIVDYEITRADFSRKIGVGPAYLTNFLRNNRNMSFKTLERTAEGYDLIPIVLYNDSDEIVENLGIEGFLAGEKVENYVGRVIRRVRRQRGLSQLQLAEKVKRSPVTINQFEVGKKGPSLELVERASIGLSLSPFYLVPKSKTRKVETISREVETVDFVDVIEEQLVRNPNISLDGLKRLIEKTYDLGANLEVIYEILREEQGLDEN